jgi:hypothetical protein
MAVPTNLLTPEMIESNKAHNGDLRNRVVEASARQKIILETINERMKQTDNTAKKLKELLEQKAKTQKKFAEALAKQKPPKVGENMKYVAENYFCSLAHSVHVLYHGDYVDMAETEWVIYQRHICPIWALYFSS